MTAVDRAIKEVERKTGLGALEAFVRSRLYEAKRREAARIFGQEDADYFWPPVIEAPDDQHDPEEDHA